VGTPRSCHSVAQNPSDNGPRKLLNLLGRSTRAFDAHKHMFLVGLISRRAHPRVYTLRIRRTSCWGSLLSEVVSETVPVRLYPSPPRPIVHRLTQIRFR
jgi:hypothetical protein